MKRWKPRGPIWKPWHTAPAPEDNAVVRASAEAVHRATLAAEIALLLGIPCSRLPALVQFGLVGIIFLGSRCPARFSPPLARHCGGPALHFLLPLEVSLLEPS